MLQVLDMLEDVDLFRLTHTSSAIHGMLQRYLERYYKGKSPLMELACGIANDPFETRLEDAVELALGETRMVGRDLRHNAPYKTPNPNAYISVVRKFNVTKHSLITSIDESGLQNDNE